jgi:hypothetical protein
MMSGQRLRGLSIYEAMLALALCGITIIALNYAAASAAVSSQVAQNRLFVQNLIRAKLAEYRGQVRELAGAEPIEFQMQSRSATFEGKVSCSQWRGSPKVYRLTVSVDWTERSREWRREKSLLVIGDEP